MSRESKALVEAQEPGPGRFSSAHSFSGVHCPECGGVGRASFNPARKCPICEGLGVGDPDLFAQRLEAFSPPPVAAPEAAPAPRAKKKTTRKKKS